MLKRIDVTDAPVLGLFDRLAKFGNRPQAALNDIGDELVQSTRLRFNESRSPSGGFWKPLAWATILARARRGRSMRRGGPLVTGKGVFRSRFRAILGGNHQPLMDTRQHLYQTLTHVVQGNSVVIGVNAPWAAIHQFGGMAGRGRKVHIPARPFLGISLQDRRDIVAILTRHALATASVQGRT